MLCCIFYVIRVLSVCFTFFNFVNTIVYWICIILDSEFQNKHIHSRNQYTPSEWVHSKQSFQPSQFPTHSQFTFVLSPHSQSLLFYSFRERKRKTPSPAQYSIPNKRIRKAIWSDRNRSLGQAISNPNQSLYNSIEAFLVIRDFISSVLCFRIEKDIEALFSLHKVWISLLSHNEK